MTEKSGLTNTICHLQMFVEWYNFGRILTHDSSLKTHDSRMLNEQQITEKVHSLSGYVIIHDVPEEKHV
jgi:hypothetical protein